MSCRFVHATVLAGLLSFSVAIVGKASAEDLIVGDTGTETLSIAGGTERVAENVLVGLQTGSDGTVNIEDPIRCWISKTG